MKRLNFYPYYRQLLADGVKTTTIRLSNREAFKPGDQVSVNVGWDLENSTHLRDGEIVKVYRKKVRDLSDVDFKGESPDCQAPEPTAMVLGAIYRKEVKLDDEVVVVKFKYL